MQHTVPMFPLNTVVFPGMNVPLRVFEDRYRALVHRLLRIDDPAERVFGSVAIREGYEVGDRGMQSLHRVGCLMQLTEADPHPDGSFSIVAVSRSRLRLGSLHTSGVLLQGEVEDLADHDRATRSGDAQVAAGRALATFERYRALLSEVRGAEVVSSPLPHDPTYLSWALAADCPLTLPQRQDLLETDFADERLAHLDELLREEIRVMTVLPSMPATEVARSRWSPN